MSPRPEEVTDGPDQDEPAHDHQCVSQPFAGSDARECALRMSCTMLCSSHSSGRCRCCAVGYGIGIKVDTIWTRGLGEGRVAGGWRSSAVGSTAHVEAVLDESDAEACSGAVLGGVGGVEQVGEEETNELEGHADHTIPDEAEEGAHWKAVNVHFIGRMKAGSEDGCFPVGRSGVCSCGFIRLCTY